MKPPYTLQELKALLPRIKKSLEKEEAENPDIKPLPPMTKDECLDCFSRLMDIAAQRPLTEGECFLHGQLLSVFESAIDAEGLGLEGRWFCVNESNLKKIVERT